MERITWKEVERAERRWKIQKGIDDVKFKVKDGFWKTVDFVENHAGAVIVGAMVVGEMANIVVKVNNSKNKADDSRRRNEEIYDPSKKIWYDIKPMSNDEKIEYAERVDKGESRYEVLKDMRKLR